MLYKPTGCACLACEKTWHYSPAGRSRCPACKGTDVEILYPEIPWLDAELALVFEAEQRIARDERGIHLDTCMESWLARHGVTEVDELCKWEEMFFAIASEARAVAAEQMEKMRTGNKDED